MNVIAIVVQMSLLLLIDLKLILIYQELCYLSIKFVNEIVALVELTLKGRGTAQVGEPWVQNKTTHVW